MGKKTQNKKPIDLFSQIMKQMAVGKGKGQTFPVE